MFVTCKHTNMMFVSTALWKGRSEIYFCFDELYDTDGYCQFYKQKASEDWARLESIGTWG